MDMRESVVMLNGGVGDVIVFSNQEGDLQGVGSDVLFDEESAIGHVAIIFFVIHVPFVHEWLGDLVQVFLVRQACQNVDDGLGGQSGYGGNADMLYPGIGEIDCVG